MTAREKLLALADRIDSIALHDARILAARGGGTQWAQMAANCFAISDALRARANTGDAS